MSFRYGGGRGRRSYGGWSPLAGAALDLAFTAGQAYGAKLSDLVVSRASSGYAQNSAGVWVPFSSGVARITDKGLLVEEARTNLLINSAPTGANWTRTGCSFGGASVTDPFGNSVQKLIADASTGNHQLITVASLSVTSGQQYTVWAFAKQADHSIFELQLNSGGTNFGAAVNVRYDFTSGTMSAIGAAVASSKMTAMGNGWWLCSLTTVAAIATGACPVLVQLAVGSESFTGDGASGTYFSHIQAEAGTFATSPILTTGAAATRALDVVKLPFTPAAAMTFYAEGFSLDSGGAQTDGLLSADDGTAANRIQIRRSGTGAGSIIVVSGNVVQQSTGYGSAGSWPVGVSSKAMAAAAANDWAVTRDGGAAIGASAVTMPSGLNQIQMGNGVGIQPLNGYLRRAAYWNSRLPNSQLQALTQ